MYQLKHSYGKKTFDRWVNETPDDLRGTETSPDEANANVWEVRSFRELLERVSFLTSMNKRLTLFFRGQQSDVWDPLPVLFRTGWYCFDTRERMDIERTSEGGETRDWRAHYWNELPNIGRRVFEICHSKKDLGLPRWRALRDIREVQWAVIQHYGLWPTPLIDVTSSLRIAASFALDHRPGEPGNHRRGFVLTVGLPSPTGSITFDIDQQLSLARLSSACPPVVRRPHYQDGFLVGRFPIYSMTDTGVLQKSNLLRRLVAKFSLIDEGNFWDEDFPIIGGEAIYPRNDPLMNHLLEEFGRNGKYPLPDLAKSFYS